MASVSPVRIEVNEQAVEIRLSPWQKVLGLLGNITVPRSEISDVHVIEEPVGEALAAGMKAGLRIPGVIYVARTINLDQAFIVRRKVPALSFAVSGEGRLRRVLISTPQARELAEQLQSASPSSGS
jgi:hypothetical protein